MNATQEKLTERQASILKFIKASIRREGFPPTSEEIARHFGFKARSGSTCHLKALEKKGYIAIRPKASRGIKVLDGKATR